MSGKVSGVTTRIDNCPGPRIILCYGCGKEAVISTKCTECKPVNQERVGRWGTRVRRKIQPITIKRSRISA